MTPRLSEFELIAELFAPLATAPGALGLRDDAAIIPPPPGCETIVTMDALVEGVHFFADDPPETIARKALRVNLSDLAAKGAMPAGYFLALTLPQRIGMDWLAAFAQGLQHDGEAFGVPLLGGDTTSTPGPLTLAITAVGHVPAGTMTRRSGAAPGDAVFVSGTIGDAGGGLEILSNRTPHDAAQEDANASPAAHLISRYRVPTPRLALGQALRGVATASLDISDGLIADLGHIAEVSSVAIRIDAASVPCSPALRAAWGDGEAAIARAATAGDDYELAFTARDEAAVRKIAQDTGVMITRIGGVTEGHGVTLIGAQGVISISRPGFRHF